MNVIEILSNELKDKNWNDVEKARYIYLRSCQLFSYDPKYHASDLLQNSYSIQNAIKTRRINLEDVEDNTAVCYSHSDQIYSKLIYEFLGIICGIGSATTLSVGNQRIITHAPVDFVRAKMGCSTPGYRSQRRDESFKTQIKQIDKEIGYIEEEYYEHELCQIKKQIEETFSKISSTQKDEQLLSKIKTIKELLESFKFQDSYSDSAACISLLQEQLLSVSEKSKVKTVPLFQDNEEGWTFVKVYKMELEEGIIYYLLEQGENGYTFNQTSFQEIAPLIENMKGREKEKAMFYRK